MFYWNFVVIALIHSRSKDNQLVSIAANAGNPKNQSKKS